MCRGGLRRDRPAAAEGAVERAGAEDHVTGRRAGAAGVVAAAREVLPLDVLEVDGLLVGRTGQAPVVGAVRLCW